MTAPGDLEVKHGYTLGDLEQMTRAAVVADRAMAADIDTRRDIAWSAIAEHLCASQEPPLRQDLIRTGWQAIYRDARDAFRQRGRPDEAWSSVEGFRPRFATYWADMLVTPSPEERVVERLAATQVVAALQPTYRDAIVALAVHDDHKAAASALGLKGKAFSFRLSTGRSRILSLWFQGETPRATRWADRRVGAYDKQPTTHCSNGHEWTPENTYVRRRVLRGKPHKSRVCRACEHDRSVARYRASLEAGDAA